MRINRSHVSGKVGDELEFGYKEGGGKVARVRLVLFLAPDTRRRASLARERYVICLRPEELPKNQLFSFRFGTSRAKTICFHESPNLL